MKESATSSSIGAIFQYGGQRTRLYVCMSECAFVLELWCGAFFSDSDWLRMQQRQLGALRDE